MNFIANLVVGVYLQFSTFDKKYSFFAFNLRQHLIRIVYFFTDAFCDFILEAFGPIADEEETTFD